MALRRCGWRASHADADVRRGGLSADAADSRGLAWSVTVVAAPAAALAPAVMCNTPIALISLVDERRQWFKSAVGLTVRETPRHLAFCAHAIQAPEQTMVVPDTLQDPRFVDNALVTGDPNIRFYAGVPLVTSTGFALGTLCVIDRQPRELTEGQAAYLEFMAREVVSMIESRPSSSV